MAQQESITKGRSGQVVVQASVEIAAPFEELKEWFQRLDHYFPLWYPDQKRTFKLLSGSMKRGSKVAFEEEIKGAKLTNKGKIVRNRVEPDRFEIAIKTGAGLGKVRYLGRRTPNGCHFTNVEEFGISIPIIGHLINFLMFNLFIRQCANMHLVLADIKKDNQQLQLALEGGSKA